MTEIQQSFFAHNEPGPRFTVKDAAAILAEPGVSAETISSQIRSFAQRQLVHVRGVRGSGRTAHNLYALSDLAATKILSILTSDLSIADNALMEAASIGLYAWDERAAKPAKRANSPILTALAQTLEKSNAEWIFHLTVSRTGETGRRSFCVRVFDSLFANPDARATTDACIIIKLRPVLSRILERARALEHGRDCVSTELTGHAGA